ncbi:MAG TPA: alpha/beta hydrolase [Planctomycetota bacterium]
MIVLALLLDVAEIKDVAYGDHAKQKLDLTVPKGAKDFPTVLFIHGGAWREGDRRLYGALGRRFAEAGVGLAATSYRLSPEVKHPEHAKDVARAFAWVHANIAAHGGSPDRLYVMGHSAGGHLAALLALDAAYLDDLKVPRGAIKGAIPMSGVYLVTALPPDTRGILKILPDAFGSDRDVCRAASPVTHVKNAACPFLVLTETDDNLKVRPSMMFLKAAVERSGAKGFEFVDAEGRDHFSIIARMMGEAEDPYRQRVLEFVLAQR